MPDPTTGKLLPGEPGYQTLGTGLIGTNPAGVDVAPKEPITGYTAAQAPATPAVATGYDPKAYNVTPDQTVQEQVRKIVGSDSLLMQQARVKAMETMNGRGLLNSSLGIQAGQEAVLGAALPIATADAAMVERAGTNTVNQQNAALNFGAAASNTASNLNAQLGTSTAVQNATATNAANQMAATAANQKAIADLQANTTLTATDKQTQANILISQADNTTKQLIQLLADASALTRTQLTTENQLAIATLDSQTKTALTTLDAQNRQLLQSNANAANMYQETVRNIAAIATDDKLDAVAKRNATATQINLLNEGLRTTAAIASTQQAAVTSLDLSSYFAGGGGLGGTPPTGGGTPPTGGGTPPNFAQPPGQPSTWQPQGRPGGAAPPPFDGESDRDRMLDIMYASDSPSNVGAGGRYAGFIATGYPEDVVKEYFLKVYGPPTESLDNGGGGYHFSM